MSTVAENYHLYPELKGIPDRIREAVTPFQYRSSKNQSMNAKAT